MIIGCDTYSNTLFKNNMYEATILKYALKNTYGCNTSVIEYKYRYSYNHQALSLLYYRRNGRRIFF